MRRINYFYLLAVLVALSFLPLDGNLSAVLFLLIAWLLWQIERSPGIFLSPVVFVAFAYVLGYPMCVLLPDFYPDLWAKTPPLVIDHTMLWAVRGFGALAFGYASVGHLNERNRCTGSQRGVFYKGRMSYTRYCLASIGWLAILSWVVSVMLFGISLTFIKGDSPDAGTGDGTLLQILSFLASLRWPFFFGFILLRFSNKTGRSLSFLFIGLFCISTVEIITIGSKESIIRVIVVVLLALSFLQIKLNLKQIIIGMVALILVFGSFSVITEYRSIMHQKLSKGYAVHDFSVQANSFAEALMASLPFYKTSSDRRTDVGQEDILGRFSSGMFSFGNMMFFTRNQPPYTHAWESFLIPFYSIAPRALIPDKPEYLNAGSNAKKFYGWTYGGISVSLLGSLYYAWGYEGLIVGMALLGGLLAYIVRQVRLFGIYAPHWVVLLVVMLVPMMEVGGTFQSTLTNFVRVVLLLWLLRKLYPMMPRNMRRHSMGLSPLKSRERVACRG
jgi:hypothetical protein